MAGRVPFPNHRPRSPNDSGSMHRWHHGDGPAHSGGNVIRQPGNRGTALGILLPLLQILHRDPDAPLLVLPSDHFVCDEAVLAESLRAAMRQIRRQPDRIVMLGISPDEADPELGYIVSDSDVTLDLRAVSEFVEKPSSAVARALIARGGVWNSFIFAAKGKTLAASVRAALSRACVGAVGDRQLAASRDPGRRSCRFVSARTQPGFLARHPAALAGACCACSRCRRVDGAISARRVV